MQKIWHLLICLLIALIFLPTFSSNASSIPFTDLIEKGSEYDGKTLILEGEAIGEYLERDDYGWVNISDGSMALGIWTNNTEGLKVITYGDYKHKGDVVKATGIFNQVCSEHGGDMDFHATNIAIQSAGQTINHELNKDRLVLSIGLLPISATILFFIFRHKNSPI